MKKYFFYILILSVLLYSGCYEDEIIDSKPGEAIDPVTDLEYAIAETHVNLRWEFPSAYPEDILQPVSVLVRITVDGQTEGTVILEEAPVSYTYTAYDPSKTYRFTVKVVGAVETSDPYASDLRYSLGKTVAF
jgi:hypothetical protein